MITINVMCFFRVFFIIFDNMQSMNYYCIIQQDIYAVCYIGPDVIGNNYPDEIHELKIKN